MNGERPCKQGKDKNIKTRTDKVLGQPGIREAIDLVREHARMIAIEEALEEGAKGELGEKAKSILESETEDALNQFIKLFGAHISDNYDESLEEFAIVVSPIIAELWNLSEGAVELISRVIYWGDDTKHAKREEAYAPLSFFMSEMDLQSNPTLIRHCHELEERGFIVYQSDQIPKGRIYLDVTELTLHRLRAGYQGIELIREYIGIKYEDLRVGAPRSVDTQKALMAFTLREEGIPRKQIANELGFKGYYDDVRAGCFPLLNKYLKHSEDINKRLGKLEEFISTIKIRNDSNINETEL